MVRNYIRKTNRASYSDTAVHAAMKFVTDGHSLREAEKKFGINYRYLKVKKSKQNFTVRYGMPRKILPANLEENLTEYAKKASKIFYGITYFSQSVFFLFLIIIKQFNTKIINIKKIKKRKKQHNVRR